jgi:hypothetical protein
MEYRRRRRVNYRERPVDGSGSDEAEDFRRGYLRQLAGRSGLAHPGTEWRMRRSLVMVRMFTGTCHCRHGGVTHRNQTHQAEIDHRRDSGYGASDSAEASDYHVYVPIMMRVRDCLSIVYRRLLLLATKA